MSGSVEALEDALLKIDVGDEVTLRVIDRGVGAITENDVNLADASTRPSSSASTCGAEGKARELADREGVDVRFYSVIYQAIDDVEAALKGMLKPELRGGGPRHRRGPRGLPLEQVRQHRRLPRAHRPHPAQREGAPRARRRRRGGQPHDRRRCERFKDDATEVREGFECGIGLGSYNDIKVDDVIETFEMREKPRG